MNNFIARIFRTKRGWLPHGTIDRAFVSEHTRFIDHFLEEHPDALAEQHTGWRIYWDKRIDLDAQKRAETDGVPDDNYGFRSFAEVGKHHG